MAEAHYLLSDYYTCLEYLQTLNNINNTLHDNRLLILIDNITELISCELEADKEYFSEGIQIFNGIQTCPDIPIDMDKLNIIKYKWDSLQSKENNIINIFIRSTCLSSNLLEGVFSINGKSISNLIYRGFYENSINGISMASRIKNKSTIVKILNNTVNVVQLMYKLLNNTNMFDISFIKLIHEKLMKNDNFIIEEIDDYYIYKLINIGKFRHVSCLTLYQSENNDEIIQFCHYSKIEEEMNNFCNYVRTMLKTNIDPFIKAAYIHAYFTIIHPFYANGIDGNGRIARILSSLPLIQTGLHPIIVKYNEKNKYFNCLHYFDITFDLIPLANFIYNSLMDEITNLSNKL